MKTHPLQELSVIIPIRRKEKAWRRLLPDLGGLPAGAEIIMVGPERPRPSPQSFLNGTSVKVRWITCEENRGQQLNLGARAAKNRFLWFLHADSRLTSEALLALDRSLKEHPSALHYFTLGFLRDGPPMMFLNGIGCWVRSQMMGVPFGDQGLCLAQKKFKSLGGFPEEAEYGEDHLFVWKARQRGIPLQGTGAVLKTSARRYAQEGWTHVTLNYAQRWVRQAIPEYYKCLKSGRLLWTS
jgi:hypothetical protein